MHFPVNLVWEPGRNEFLKDYIKYEITPSNGMLMKNLLIGINNGDKNFVEKIYPVCEGKFSSSELDSWYTFNIGDIRQTPIIWALRWRNYELLQKLLQWGANPNMLNGSTPDKYYVQKEHFQLPLLFALSENLGDNFIELLLQNGADPDLKDLFGTCPRDFYTERISKLERNINKNKLNELPNFRDELLLKSNLSRRGYQAEFTTLFLAKRFNAYGDEEFYFIKDNASSKIGFLVDENLYLSNPLSVTKNDIENVFSKHTGFQSNQFQQVSLKSQGNTIEHRIYSDDAIPYEDERIQRFILVVEVVIKDGQDAGYKRKESISDEKGRWLNRNQIKELVQNDGFFSSRTAPVMTIFSNWQQNKWQEILDLELAHRQEGRMTFEWFRNGEYDKIRNWHKQGGNLSYRLRCGGYSTDILDYTFRGETSKIRERFHFALEMGLKFCDDCYRPLEFHPLVKTLEIGDDKLFDFLLKQSNLEVNWNLISSLVRGHNIKVIRKIKERTEIDFKQWEVGIGHDLGINTWLENGDKKVIAEVSEMVQIFHQWGLDLFRYPETQEERKQAHATDLRDKYFYGNIFHPIFHLGKNTNDLLILLKNLGGNCDQGPKETPEMNQFIEENDKYIYAPSPNEYLRLLKK